jgi:hypothetical protein
MAFTDSADAVFSAEASDGRATATVTGLGGTVFFDSSRAGAAGPIDAVTAEGATAIGEAPGFGSAISSGSGMAFGGALMLATSLC